jgi:hypothetical protein
MIRALNVLLLVSSAVCFVGVYVMKASVEETASAKLQLQRTIEQQEGDLSLLKADWALLNQPGHIEPIVARHAEALGLEPIAQEQFGTIEALPMRPAAPDSDALDDLFRSLDAGVDPIGAILAEEMSDEL